MNQRYPVLTEQVRGFFERPFVKEAEGILVGLSGGQDSCALLHCIVDLSGEFGITVSAAHLNHGIRGVEADEDERFCKALALSLGIPLFTDRADVKGEARRMHRSLQETARNARFRFLHRAADELGAAHIALGHTEDDHIETVLMNIIRGTGIDGLAGLKPADGRIIRPLRGVSRAETEAYCRKHGITFRQDTSNQSLRYMRNRVRAELLPDLAAYYNPAIRQAVLRISETAGEDARYLDTLASQALSSVTLRATADIREMDCVTLAAMNAALGRRILRKAIESVRGNLVDVSFEAVESVLESARAGRSYGMTLPGAGVAVDVNPARVVVKRIRAAASSRPVEIEMRVPGRTEAPEFGGVFTVLETVAEQPLSQWECALDADSVRGPLRIRNRRAGDRLQPLGLSGTKKVQDLLVDKKVPEEERDRVPIIVDDCGILWAVGLALSERAKVTTQTRRILRVEFENPERESARSANYNRLTQQGDE